MSPASTSSTPFYRNLWRLTERKKKHKKDSLTSNHSNSDEVVTDNDNNRQQQSVQSARETSQPKGNVVHRGMDRIRRSFRESFRRRMPRQYFAGGNSSGRQSPNGPSNTSNSSKAGLWQPDEVAVLNGTCSFHVRYLGGIEVFESRGMQICEGALKLLRGQRRRPIKAILYVSGDGLRVVDQESSRGLIVDQTIEKVSFCAPDRNHEKGFAYICRDGTSRRWMCHGFHATKESGERLSHAVGCAFAICLERKKKRDAEAAAAVQAAAGLPPLGCEKPSTAGFTLSGIAQQQQPSSQMNSFERTLNQSSFRRLSITERLQDPQTAIVQQPPSTPATAPTELHITPKPRPVGNPLLFERQGSLRAPTSSMNGTSAFRRQLSLRSYSDSPVKRQQQQQITSSTLAVRSEPIFEDDEERSWSNGGTLNEGSTFENAPYNPVKYNGFRQSLSYTATSSTNAVGLCGARSQSVVNSPLQVQTSCSSNASAPQSWLSSPTSACPSSTTAKSKADEWLEQTLRSSLSLNSPYRNVISMNKASYSSSEVGHLHGHPPPSVPNLSTPNATIHSTIESVAPQTGITFNTDFSKCELPPIIENFVHLSEIATVPSTSTGPEVDVFGQPVFSPLPLKSRAVQKIGHMNGSASSAAAVQPDEPDPFDVRWSELAVNAATTYHPSPVRSTNPFIQNLVR